MADAMPILMSVAAMLVLLSACAGGSEPDAPAKREYSSNAPLGIGGDLYGFFVTLKGAQNSAEIEDYVGCVVAGYTLEKKFGFARHVRTKVKEEGGVWTADAVYTISSALPRGLRTMDAEVTAADCAVRGIPTV
jgi:hypothetical protein